MAGEQVVGLLLAGGQARRMGGGDKCLIPLSGRPMLAHAIARAQPQVGHLVISANGDPDRFADYGCPVVPDPVSGFAGPLAGVLAGLDWARIHHPECPWVATIATDTPNFPSDLVVRLLEAVDGDAADMACAASGGRAHPVFGLWPVRLADELRQALVMEDVRKVVSWTGRYRLAEVEFSATPNDPFFNVNRPEDIGEAERVMAEAAE